MDQKPKYRRILLKLSGEALTGNHEHVIDPDVLRAIALEIKEAHQLGVQIAVVLGGGNICRGATLAGLGLDRALADTMGMMATIINALALQGALENLGVPARVQSAIVMPSAVEPFTRWGALEHLGSGRVLICAAGTGNPYFTTDTAACLRALQIDAEVVLKATRVDGVYSSDPEIHPDARFFPSLDYDRVLADNLRVMDSTAIALCREHNLPIVVFNLTKQGNIRRAILGETIGTRVSHQADARGEEP